MSPHSDDTLIPGHVLVVCTGNICRSPYIERLLDHELSGMGIAVSSAGTGALVGAHMDSESARLLKDAGIDPNGFAARQVTSQMVASADLVIGAAREHVSSVVPLHPRSLRYAFSLRDLANVLTAAEPHEVAAADGDTQVAKVAAVAIAARDRVNPLTPETAGVIDPFRRGPAAFDQMVREIAAALPPVVAALTSRHG